MGAPNDSTPFKLTYTKGDWKILQFMAQRKGSHDFRSYLNNALHKAAKNPNGIFTPDDEACDDCTRIGNTYFIPEDICQEIIQIATNRCAPLSSTIRFYFVDPLIKEFIENGLRAP